MKQVSALLPQLVEELYRNYRLAEHRIGEQTVYDVPYPGSHNTFNKIRQGLINAGLEPVETSNVDGNIVLRLSGDDAVSIREAWPQLTPPATIAPPPPERPQTQVQKPMTVVQQQVPMTPEPARDVLSAAEAGKLEATLRDKFKRGEFSVITQKANGFVRKEDAILGGEDELKQLRDQMARLPNPITTRLVTVPGADGTTQRALLPLNPGELVRILNSEPPPGWAGRVKDSLASAAAKLSVSLRQ